MATAGKPLSQTGSPLPFSMETTENGDGLSALHEKCFVILEPAKRLDDCVERFPVSRSFSCSAIDNQILRSFSHVRVEVVHQHPERRFLLPRFAGDLGPSERADRSAIRR